MWIKTQKSLVQYLDCWVTLWRYLQNFFISSLVPLSVLWWLSLCSVSIQNATSFLEYAPVQINLWKISLFTLLYCHKLFKKQTKLKRWAGMYDPCRPPLTGCYMRLPLWLELQETNLWKKTKHFFFLSSCLPVGFISIATIFLFGSLRVKKHVNVTLGRICKITFFNFNINRCFRSYS